MAQSQPPMTANPKLDALKREFTKLDLESTPEIGRLVDNELYRLTQDSMAKGPPANPDYIDLNEKMRIKISHKVVIPVEYFPGYNFVGKLLGNKGENLKKLCTETNTRMAIMGRGSTRERNKEQELLESGAPEYQHIREPLHVRVESHGPCQQVWTNMAAAMEALAPYMKPDDTYVPQPHQWGMAPGWGHDVSYGSGGGVGRGSGRGVRGGGGRGDARGSFTPRGHRGGRGGGFRGGAPRGGGGGQFGDGYGDDNGCDEEMEFDDGGDSFGNGYGQTHSSFGKVLPRGGGGGGGGGIGGSSRGLAPARGPVRGRGLPRGGRPY